MKYWLPVLMLIALRPVVAQQLTAAEDRPSPPSASLPKVSHSDALTAAQWKRVDEGVDRGLAWLAAQQQDDGSFPTYETGQPAITSLAVMAFLSRGHAPGVGPYGQTIDRAIDFVLAQQRDNGLLFAGSTSMPVNNWGEGSHAAMYNHAIAGLMLGEAYGMTDERRGAKLRPAIEHALEFARKSSRPQFARAENATAWRYFHPQQVDQFGTADLSITSWHIMFYRSARNADFDVSKEEVESAVKYVKKCFVPQTGAFVYGVSQQGDLRFGRGMTGAGLLCLLQTDNYNEQVAHAAGEWILKHPFTTYNRGAGSHDRFHYGAYYCSQAMFLLGGDYWKRFYPTLATTLLDHQTPEGHWQLETKGGQTDGRFGVSYTTALAILSLTPPYQLLPIYQR
jgi:hypothetical protein